MNSKLLDTKKINLLRKKNSKIKIGLAHGVYDLFHFGHLKHLKTAKSKCDIVVVTGGEPLLWNMTPLTKLLKKNNLKAHIETSGSNKLTGEWDWICLSPKKRKLPTDEVCDIADELKVIVYNNSDFKFAEEQAKKVNSKCLLYLQPEWSKRDLMIPKIVDYVMKNSKWKISLQTHKYLKIP